MILKIIVLKDDSNQTIFNFLKKVISFDKTKINLYKLFRKKKIKLNNNVLKDYRYFIRENDVIDIYSNQVFLKKQRDKVLKTKIKPKIVYEDENILIVDKEHGMLVHNLYGESLDNIIKNFLIDKNEYDIKKNQSFLISHIHRLDKTTRGLIIYAKNKKTSKIFLEKINDKKFINKFYLLKCEGIVKEKIFTLNGFIYKDENKKKMIFSKKEVYNSKSCITNFKLIKIDKNFSILEAELITGRKNQIRASLEYLNHPILNDYKYGAKKISNKNKIYLFAYKIVFNNFSKHLKYLNNKIITINIDIKN